MLSWDKKNPHGDKKWQKQIHREHVMERQRKRGQEPLPEKGFGEHIGKQGRW